MAQNDQGNTAANETTTPAQQSTENEASSENSSPMQPRNLMNELGTATPPATPLLSDTDVTPPRRDEASVTRCIVAMVTCLEIVETMLEVGVSETMEIGQLQLVGDAINDVRMAALLDDYDFQLNHHLPSFILKEFYEQIEFLLNFFSKFE
jgi:hypothetical protein